MDLLTFRDRYVLLIIALATFLFEVVCAMLRSGLTRWPVPKMFALVFLLDRAEWVPNGALHRRGLPREIVPFAIVVALRVIHESRS
jgi:hypothetical protein